MLSSNGNRYLDIWIWKLRMWATKSTCELWMIPTRQKCGSRMIWYEILHATWQSISQLHTLSPILWDKPLHTLNKFASISPSTLHFNTPTNSFNNKNGFCLCFFCHCSCCHFSQASSLKTHFSNCNSDAKTLRNYQLITCIITFS